LTDPGNGAKATLVGPKTPPDPNGGKYIPQEPRIEFDNNGNGNNTRGGPREPVKPRPKPTPNPDPNGRCIHPISKGGSRPPPNKPKPKPAPPPGRKCSHGWRLRPDADLLCSKRISLANSRQAHHGTCVLGLESNFSWRRADQRIGSWWRWWYVNAGSWRWYSCMTEL